MSYKCVGIVCRKYPIRIRMCIDPIPKWKPPLRRFVLPSRMEFLATLEFRSCDNATDFHIFLLAKKKAPPPPPRLLFGYFVLFYKGIFLQYKMDGRSEKVENSTQ